MMEPELSYGRFAISGPRCYGFENLFTRSVGGREVAWFCGLAVGFATFKPPLRASASPRETPLRSFQLLAMLATVRPLRGRAREGDCEDPHRSVTRSASRPARPHSPAVRTTRSHA